VPASEVESEPSQQPHRQQHCAALLSRISAIGGDTHSAPGRTTGATALGPPAQNVGLCLSTFPMFVPSLSWQNDGFYIQDCSTQGRFSHRLRIVLLLRDGILRRVAVLIEKPSRCNPGQVRLVMTHRDEERTPRLKVAEVTQGRGCKQGLWIVLLAVGDLCPCARPQVRQERREDIVCAAASSKQHAAASRVSCSQLPYPVSFTQDAFGGTNMLRLPSLHSKSFILSPLSYLTDSRSKVCESLRGERSCCT
jgi:hypothetical protein